MITEQGVTMADLMRWEELIDQMPYYHRMSVGGRDCVVVHAGYIECLEDIETEDSFSEIEDFYL